jgi:hypothetical protein
MNCSETKFGGLAPENHIVKKKMSQTLPVMSGGMREIVFDFSKKHSFQAQAIITALLVIAITFVAQVPQEFKNQSNTTMGRLFLFGLLVLVCQYTDWVYGLLLAVFIALLMSSAKIVKEGFMSEIDTRIVDSKRKWWVEEVLNENPIAIQDDRIKTMAVQDNDLQQRSSVQDTKSSSNVSQK